MNKNELADVSFHLKKAVDELQAALDLIPIKGTTPIMLYQKIKCFIRDILWECEHIDIYSENGDKYNEQ